MVDSLWAIVAHQPELAERLTVFPRDLAHLLLYGLEIPIITVCRAFDRDGEPVGYRLLAGAEHLLNAAYRSAYEQLPQQFTFAQAKQVYGRTDQPTDDFLKKCASAGILRKVKKGLYEKITSPIGVNEQGENLC